MTLQGLPGVSRITALFVQSVREFTRDYPQLNRLTRGEESNNRQIAWALGDALDNFNGTPHFTDLTLEELIVQYKQSHLMMRLTTCSLIESVGLLQTRNHIDYNTGGTRVAVNSKTPMLMEWLRMFQATTEQRKQQVKVAINIGQMLGTSPSGLHSEYWYTNHSYVTY